MARQDRATALIANHHPLPLRLPASPCVGINPSMATLPHVIPSTQYDRSNSKTVSFRSRSRPLSTARKSEFVDVPTTYEGLILRKDVCPPYESRPSWSHINVLPMSESSQDLEQRILGKPPLSLSAACHSLRSARQRAELNRLLEEKQKAESNKRAQWVLVSVDEERGPQHHRRNLTETKAIHVIFKKQLKPVRKLRSAGEDPYFVGTITQQPLPGKQQPSRNKGSLHESSKYHTVSASLHNLENMPHAKSQHFVLSKDRTQEHAASWTSDLERTKSSYDGNLSIKNVVSDASTRGFTSDKSVLLRQQKTQSLTSLDSLSATLQSNPTSQSLKLLRSPGILMDLAVSTPLQPVINLAHVPPVTSSYRSPTVEDTSEDESPVESLNWSCSSDDASSPASTPTSLSISTEFKPAPCVDEFSLSGIRELDSKLGLPDSAAAAHTRNPAPSLHQKFYEVHRSSRPSRVTFPPSKEERRHIRQKALNTLRTRVDAVEKSEAAYIQELEELCREEARLLKEKLHELAIYKGQTCYDMCTTLQSEIKYTPRQERFRDFKEGNCSKNRFTGDWQQMESPFQRSNAMSSNRPWVGISIHEEFEYC